MRRYLIFTACLLVVGATPAISRDAVPTGKKLLRLVCQTYFVNHDVKLKKLIVLDQLSTRTYPESDYTPEITGEMILKSPDPASPILGMVKGRLRVYDDVSVSLFNIVYNPVKDEIIKAEVTKKFDRRLEGLLTTTQVGKDRIGRKMDYTGVIIRSPPLFHDIALIQFYHGDPSDIAFRRNTSCLRSDVRCARPKYQAQFETTHLTFENTAFRRGELDTDYQDEGSICGPPIFIEEKIEQ